MTRESEERSLILLTPLSPCQTIFAWKEETINSGKFSLYSSRKLLWQIPFSPKALPTGLFPRLPLQPERMGSSDSIYSFPPYHFCAPSTTLSAHSPKVLPLAQPHLTLLPILCPSKIISSFPWYLQSSNTCEPLSCHHLAKLYIFSPFNLPS